MAGIIANRQNLSSVKVRQSASIPPGADARGRIACFLEAMRTLGAAALAIGIAACSSSSEGEAPAFKCALGELRGTWRLSYKETNGDCGPIADETVVLTGGTSAAPAACTQDALVISDDKCRMDLDFTCPAGNNGSQTWTGATRQVAEDRLIGDMTAQATIGTASCRSTYEITWQRQ
jgi:hypothetical protein